MLWFKFQLIPAYNEDAWLLIESFSAMMAILDGELQLLNISFKGNQPRTFQAIFGLNLLQCFKEDLNIENTQPQHKKDGYHFDKRTQIIKY
jgi:hypothetical protein